MNSTKINSVVLSPTLLARYVTLLIWSIWHAVPMANPFGCRKPQIKQEPLIGLEITPHARWLFCASLHTSAR